jgi:hypothetical protein
MSDFSSPSGPRRSSAAADGSMTAAQNGGAASGSPTTGVNGDQVAMHRLRVEPSRTMKAVTSDIEELLDGLDDSSRRRAALLASELIAQVIGRAPRLHGEAAHLAIQLRGDAVRLEATGPVAPAVDPRADRDAAPAEPLADWGRFILDSLADRWGIAGGAGGSIWAEIAASPPDVQFPA